MASTAQAGHSSGKLKMGLGVSATIVFVGMWMIYFSVVHQTMAVVSDSGLIIAVEDNGWGLQWGGLYLLLGLVAGALALASAVACWQGRRDAARQLFVVLAVVGVPTLVISVLALAGLGSVVRTPRS